MHEVLLIEECELIAHIAGPLHCVYAVYKHAPVVGNEPRQCAAYISCGHSPDHNSFSEYLPHSVSY